MVKIFDAGTGPWNVIIEPLLNKIQVVDFEASKLEDFWNDDITQYSLVIEKYPNIAIEVYENQDERLSLILLESIALDMADSLKNVPLWNKEATRLDKEPFCIPRTSR